MSNVELLGDDATMNVMGGIFGSYAAQNDNTEMDSRFYEKNMDKIRDDDRKIKLDIDMAMPTNIALQESNFMPSDRDTRKSSARQSNLNTDRVQTLAIMKKEMEQAKRIIDKFQESTQKESQSLKRFNSKSAL